MRGRVDHGISPQTVSFRLVLESETAEGSEAGNDCVGPEDPFHIYTMLKTGTPYNEECFEQRRLRCERKRANRLVNELQKLGYVVVAPD